jgi:glyoxylate reductase
MGPHLAYNLTRAARRATSLSSTCYVEGVRVAATTSLPVDLSAQLAARLPGAVAVLPAGGRAPIGELPLDDIDGLICLLTDRIDAAVLARAPRLRVVATCSVGVDNVDLAAATAAGVAVTNTPDVLTEPTAELAFALMLAAARRLGEGERLIRAGAWHGWALDLLLGVPLAGRTVGIVGLGRIGQAFARRCVGFGMRVIYAGPREVASAAGLGAERVSVDALCARADVISLHCPLTPDTRRVIDRDRLALMKPTAILVNTARGDCVDEAAVAEALRAGRLFGAALDVFTGEPVIAPALLDCPRLVLAPHLGSAPPEARTAMAQRCVDGVIEVLAGRRPANLVNPQVELGGPRP